MIRIKRPVSHQTKVAGIDGVHGMCQAVGGRLAEGAAGIACLIGAVENPWRGRPHQPGDHRCGDACQMPAARRCGSGRADLQPLHRGEDDCEDEVDDRPELRKAGMPEPGLAI